jgi:hypothetical protein
MHYGGIFQIIARKNGRDAGEKRLGGERQSKRIPWVTIPANYPTL